MAAIAGVQAVTAGLVIELGMAARTLMLFESYLAIVHAPKPAAAAMPIARVPDGDRQPVGDRTAPELRVALEVRDGWFRYQPDAPWVLRGLNLRMRAGQTLALVGVNGAGKSTLVKLLCRFWELERGQILWDGIDIRELDPLSLRARIATTFQDFMTYDATAGDNIGFGDVRYLGDLDRVRAAARLSEIDDKLCALPAGYETLLSRTLANDATDEEADGVLVSGGEWQRIALARCLLRADADLFILDEPSSGLDPEAESRLHDVLSRHGEHRTRLLISHRLGSLRDADQIAVLANGQIVEQGNHEQLMGLGGRYAELFARQAVRYQDARVVQRRELQRHVRS
jgi:ATP-binding cassette subfamily B protein